MALGSLQADREAGSNNKPQHEAPLKDQLPRYKQKRGSKSPVAETSALQATPNQQHTKQRLRAYQSTRRARDTNGFRN
ncbi:unnamed protein product [Arabidopsis halleri]